MSWTVVERGSLEEGAGHYRVERQSWMILVLNGPNMRFQRRRWRIQVSFSGQPDQMVGPFRSRDEVSEVVQQVLAGEKLE